MRAPWGRKKADPGERGWKKKRSCARPTLRWSRFAASSCASTRQRCHVKVVGVGRRGRELGGTWKCFHSLRSFSLGNEMPYTRCRLSFSALPSQYAELFFHTCGAPFSGDRGKNRTQCRLFNGYFLCFCVTVLTPLPVPVVVHVGGLVPVLVLVSVPIPLIVLAAVQERFEYLEGLDAARVRDVGALAEVDQRPAAVHGARAAVRDLVRDELHLVLVVLRSVSNRLTDETRLFQQTYGACKKEDRQINIHSHSHSHSHCHNPQSSNNSVFLFGCNMLYVSSYALSTRTLNISRASFLGTINRSKGCFSATICRTTAAMRPKSS